MFFAVSKLCAWLAYPLTVFLMALAAGIVWHRKAWSRWMLAGLLTAMYVCSLPLTKQAMFRWIEAPPVALEALQPSYDVVVVLSGSVDLTSSAGGRIEFNDGVERVLEGIDLVRQGRAEYVCFSGGSGLLFHQEFNEAELQKRFAVHWGVPAERILVEGRSRNTVENARQTVELLRARGLEQVLLVTSAFHMQRARAIFRHLGLACDVFPVDYRADTVWSPLSLLPSADALHGVTVVVRELIGLTVYRLCGYL